MVSGHGRLLGGSGELNWILKGGRDLEKTKGGIPGCHFALEPMYISAFVRGVKVCCVPIDYWVLRAPVQEQVVGFSFPAESMRLK